ncbi:MAG: hypothetical protein DIZ78_01265 [endosymbiont of Escarpia spicata]|uniref:MtrB/PioB family decaheme-associated outer membrane protein n=1 Tax=endosymbiont of Escarpia spicata TaxID=2200908 RepID=A0A370DVB5_9GAMM|nr:MAG: hypothetical protein DIZ78_01265 [endosymbiont of Escarpia spicata]
MEASIIQSLGQQGNYCIGEAEVGIGYVSDDYFKFGRYTGLHEKGAYVNANAHLYFKEGRADYASVQASDLGLDSRSLRLEYGKQGKYDFFIDYDQLPNYKIDTAATPFDGAGSNHLTLPGGFDINTNVDDHLKPFDIETERRRLRASASWSPMAHYKLSLAVKHETKKGTDSIGTAIGGSGQSFMGNVATALLPEPIDYVTNEIDLAASYADKKMQWELKYHMSFFENNEQALSWENPWFASGSGPEEGQISLAPSNQFYQLSLTGSYLFTPTTRLSGVISRGTMYQDESFLPYSTLATSAALPVDSLEGEVDITNARFSLHARPMRSLRLNAGYSYSERDNKTPQATYNYTRLDTVEAVGAVTNEPVSYKKHRYNLGARYRLNNRADTSLEYIYDKTNRTFSEVEENEEQTVKAGLKLSPLDTLDASLKIARSSRDASEYQSADFEHPLLRKYYYADRDRNSAGLRLDYYPHQAVSLGFSADYAKDDYRNSEIGLVDSSQPSYTVDISYAPNADLSIYSYYTREEMDTFQVGSGPGGAGGGQGAIRDWTADIEDVVDTMGIGFKHAVIKDKLEIGADYAYSKSAENIMLTDSTNAATSQYPDLTTKLHSLKLSADYRASKQMRLKLSYLYEKFDSTDWALDDIAADAASQTLLLGNESPDYDVSAIMLYLNYALD